jgi:hypothetical protein
MISRFIMMSIMKTYFSLFLLSVCFFPWYLHAGNGTDSSRFIRPTLVLSYLNTSNDSVILTASVDVRKESGSFSLQNALIDFVAKFSGNSQFLGNALTDGTGKAMVKISTKSVLPMDKDGKTLFQASFSRKGKYLSATDSISAKGAKLLVSFSKTDSIRNIVVTASQMEKPGVLSPVKGLTVNIYTPRLFSNLKIGEITLGDDGTGKLECPNDIIGDSLGALTIIARIEDDDLFNTVQGQSSINWGIPKQFYLAEMPTRELWTPIAPLWMIITLIIMLTGVWGHYIYAVVQLVIIKRISRQKKM